MKFVESQNVTLNYSERIAPAKSLSLGGKVTPSFGECKLPRTFLRSCMKSRIYVAQGFMWCSPLDARKDRRHARPSAT